ncbi:MAG: hypothetical protein AB2L14_25205 [Candidatus Xenobiia bacterium LiM19]
MAGVDIQYCRGFFPEARFYCLSDEVEAELEKILYELLKPYLPPTVLHIETMEEMWMRLKPRGKTQKIPWLDNWKVKVEDVAWKES